MCACLCACVCVRACRDGWGVACIVPFTLWLWLCSLQLAVMQRSIDKWRNARSVRLLNDEELASVVRQCDALQQKRVQFEEMEKAREAREDAGEAEGSDEEDEAESQRTALFNSILGACAAASLLRGNLAVCMASHPAARCMHVRRGEHGAVLLRVRAVSEGVAAPAGGVAGGVAGHRTPCRAAGGECRAPGAGVGVPQLLV